MSRQSIRLCLVVAAITLLSVSQVSAQPFAFNIPGDDASPTVVDRSVLLGGPVARDFVHVQDGHFFVGKKRIKFWGMNVCFGANFPTHDDADRIAGHLAKLGVNAVRFHHMDMQDSPGGIWGGVDANGQRQFSDQAVDRLDYFLAKLHDVGIYADLNLHVSRTLSEEEGFPVADGMPWWASANKWVMYYDRDVQAEVKRYCRMLLTHRNPYRGDRRRADDPGIALIEMLNENYFSVQGYDLYRRMPERFQRSLIERWNEWLIRHYNNEGKMKAAWESVQPKMGADVIAFEDWKSGFEKSNLRSRWTTNEPDSGLPTKFIDGPSSSTGRSIRGAVRFEPHSKTDNDYDQQLTFPRLATDADQPLTLEFWARSDRERSFRVELSSSAGGEWRDLGLFETITATSEWKRYERVIFPGETLATEVRLAFSFGNDRTPIEFSSIRLRKGAVAAPLPRHQSLSDRTIGIPESGWPVASHRDMKQFMVDTEYAWVNELKSYLRDELGVKVPITASQVNYHHPSVHTELNDFVDLHNYWHHPMFPSDAEWSPTRWTIGNDPIEADPTRSDWPANSLLMRMGWRYKDKPMTLSEWNYPEPSPFGGGSVPIAAVLCGLQDWDAVFFFQYDQNNTDLFRNKADDFFSFNGAPVKLALFSQFGNLFTRGDLTPLRESRAAPLDKPIDGRFGLRYRLNVAKNATAQQLGEVPDATKLVTPDQQVRWTSTPPTSGYLELNTLASRGVWGTIANRSFDIGDMRIRTNSVDPNYGFVLASTTDGHPIETADNIVLLVASHSQNQRMGWNGAGTSVGGQWGDGPTMVTTVPTTITIPGRPVRRCFALDGKGGRRQEVGVDNNDGVCSIRTSPDDKTIWYELVR